MAEVGRPQGADTPPDGYHPNGWCTPARLVLLWLASLDKESMAQARRMVTLDDIIAKAQEALAFSRAHTPQAAPTLPGDDHWHAACTSGKGDPDCAWCNPPAAPSDPQEIP